jgi:hypothetical protein
VTTGPVQGSLHSLVNPASDPALFLGPFENHLMSFTSHLLSFVLGVFFTAFGLVYLFFFVILRKIAQNEQIASRRVVNPLASDTKTSNLNVLHRGETIGNDFIDGQSPEELNDVLKIS